MSDPIKQTKHNLNGLINYLQSIMNVYKKQRIKSMELIIHKLQERQIDHLRDSFSSLSIRFIIKYETIWLKEMDDGTRFMIWDMIKKMLPPYFHALFSADNNLILWLNVVKKVAGLRIRTSK